MRSSYQSSWRLFARHPEVTTKGFYVFAAEGTPHYPGPHNYGSRDWTSDERLPEPLLGEVTDAPRLYSLGASRDPLPPAGLIGDRDCIARGETWPLPLIDRTIDGGFDSRCWQFTPPPADDPPFILDLRDCHTQRRMAEVSLRLYTGDGSDAVALFSGYYPTATISVVPNSTSPFPGSLIATIGTYTVVIVSGTTTPQQWALQALDATANLVDYGPYSTLALWQQAAGVLLTRIATAGADPNGPIALVGHSYGGVVASLLAFRCRAWIAGRSIQLLTFGMPKPGDLRLIEGLKRVDQVHMVNDDDPVCYMPPSGVELFLLAGVVPIGLASRWNLWERPSGRVGLSREGVRTDSPRSDNLLALMWRVVGQAVAGQPLDVLTAHNSAEYVRRVICPNQPAPTPTPESLLLRWYRIDELQGLNVGDPVLSWPDVSGQLGELVGDPGMPLAFAGGPGGPTIGWVESVTWPSMVEAPAPAGVLNDHAIYIVGARGTAFTLTGPQVGSFGATTTWFKVSATTISYRGTGGTMNIANALADGELHLWSVRRWPDRIEVSKDGVVLQDTSGIALGSLLVPSFGSEGTFPAGLRTSRVSEYQLWQLAPSDELHATITYYLMVKYGLITF